jgi:hypothetical protein
MLQFISQYAVQDQRVAFLIKTSSKFTNMTLMMFKATRYNRDFYKNMQNNYMMINSIRDGE